MILNFRSLDSVSELRAHYPSFFMAELLRSWDADPGILYNKKNQIKGVFLLGKPQKKNIFF